MAAQMAEILQHLMPEMFGALLSQMNPRAAKALKEVTPTLVYRDCLLKR